METFRKAALIFESLGLVSLPTPAKCGLFEQSAEGGPIQSGTDPGVVDAIRREDELRGGPGGEIGRTRLPVPRRSWRR